MFLWKGRLREIEDFLLTERFVVSLLMFQLLRDDNCDIDKTTEIKEGGYFSVIPLMQCVLVM